jgi:hypothetical protein
MGWRSPDLGYATRREPRIDPSSHDVVALQQPQYENAIMVQRGGGQVDAPDGTPRIRAGIRHDYGLGPAYARPGPEGRDPIIGKYGNDIRQLIPPPSGVHGQFPREHQLSDCDVMGSDLLASFGLET